VCVCVCVCDELLWWSDCRYWIRHFPMSFDLNPELSQAIHRLQEVIIQDDDEDSELAGMVDISNVSVYLILID